MGGGCAKGNILMVSTVGLRQLLNNQLCVNRRRQDHQNSFLLLHRISIGLRFVMRCNDLASRPERNKLTSWAGLNYSSVIISYGPRGNERFMVDLAKRPTNWISSFANNKPFCWQRKSYPQQAFYPESLFAWPVVDFLFHSWFYLLPRHPAKVSFGL